MATEEILSARLQAQANSHFFLIEKERQVFPVSYLIKKVNK